MALGSAVGLVVLIDRLGARARIAVPLGIIAGPVVALAPVAILGPLGDGGIRHALAMLAVAGVVLAVVAALAAVAGAEHWRIVTGSVLVVTLLAGGTAVVVNSLFHHTSPRPGPVDVSATNAVSHDQIEARRAGSGTTPVSMTS